MMHTMGFCSFSPRLDEFFPANSAFDDTSDKSELTKEVIESKKHFVEPELEPIQKTISENKKPEGRNEIILEPTADLIVGLVIDDLVKEIVNKSVYPGMSY